VEPALRDIVRRALDEDAAWNDVTSRAVVPEGLNGVARLVAREFCVFAGIDAFAAAFYLIDPSIQVASKWSDGWQTAPEDELAVVTGKLRSILAAERTALNFVQRLSGIATLTHRFRGVVGGAVEIRDTRKTTPGLRMLEKRAVVSGGGKNHRHDLGAAILIKDNHIAACDGDIATAIRRAKATGKHVEVECDTLDQVEASLAAGADELLLDNMDVRTLKAAVALAAGKAKTEASGGVTLDNVAGIAATGVDSISVGALTHSAPAIDLSLEVEVV
jgi:nicotinate-nucleotide pyrophosphorylase (carboxylating)